MGLVMCLGSEISQSPGSKELDSGGAKANFTSCGCLQFCQSKEADIQKDTGMHWLGKTLVGFQSKLLLRTAPVRAGCSVPCSNMFGYCKGRGFCSIPGLPPLMVSIFSFFLTGVFPSSIQVQYTSHFAILHIKFTNESREQET